MTFRTLRTAAVGGLGLLATTALALGLVVVADAGPAATTGTPHEERVPQDPSPSPLPDVPPPSSSGSQATASGSSAIASGSQATASGRHGTVQTQWNGPTTHLDWRSADYATVEADFVGQRVLSPGDRVQRTLTVDNASPSRAVMSVTLIADSAPSDGGTEPSLARDVDLFWNVDGVVGSQHLDGVLTTLDAGEIVAQVMVPQEATVPVTVGIAMDPGATARGASAGGTLAFTVQVRMQGVAAGSDGSPRSVAVPPVVLLTLGPAAAGALVLVGARRWHRCDGRAGRRRRWLSSVLPWC